MEMAIVPVLNPTPQSFTTILNVSDTIPSSQPTKSPKFVETSADIPMTDMPTAKETPLQEEIHQENEGSQSNPDLQGQYVSTSSQGKETVESVPPKEKDTIDMGNEDLASPVPHMVPQILEISQEKDTQLTTDPNPNVEPKPFLSTEVTKTQDSRATTSYRSSPSCKPRVDNCKDSHGFTFFGQ